MSAGHLEDVGPRWALAVLAAHGATEVAAYVADDTEAHWRMLIATDIGLLVQDEERGPHPVRGSRLQYWDAVHAVMTTSVEQDDQGIRVDIGLRIDAVDLDEPPRGRHDQDGLPACARACIRAVAPPVHDQTWTRSYDTT
jgi:hypothetical protein